MLSYEFHKKRLTKNLRIMNKYNNDQYLVKGSVSVSLILARTIAEYFRQSSCCVCRGRVGGCGDLSATRVMQIYQGAGKTESF